MCGVAPISPRRAGDWGQSIGWGSLRSVELTGGETENVASIDVLDGVRDRRIERPDGRILAFTEWGDPSGTPLLRVPGTPGCRYSLRADRSNWAERNLWAITTERPGFGASTPLPGRGFTEPADDLAAILDELGVERAHCIGGSGSAPHQLAFAARHPDRVRAMTILVGAAPIADEEADQMVGVNAESYRLVVSEDRDGLRKLLEGLREAILEDPLASIRHTMDKAPDADRAVMTDPNWQAAFEVSAREAVGQGVDGWVDEGFAILRAWGDITLADVKTSVTWWHAASDANALFSAAERLVAQLPNARLNRFGDDEGHFAPYHREAEILDELLARG
jgi:pimeloyl-ACP methyl ester carboxylesterase